MAQALPIEDASPASDDSLSSNASTNGLNSRGSANRAGSPSGSGPQRSPAQLRQSRINAVMRLLRKIHLYSGIFMFPWVMIYGVSALLFNHPTLFSDNPAPSEFGREVVAGAGLETLPAPDLLAKEVVAAMGKSAAEAGKAGSVVLIDPQSAKFARSQATITTSGNDQRYTVALDLDGDGGTVRSRREEAPPAARPENRPTFPTTNLAIETPAAAKVREAAMTVLSRINIPTSETVTVALPDLNFNVQADGKPWIVNYNFERRAATARPADVPASTLTTRSYLLKLHLVHGYPESFTAKTLWCIAVDAMFASMVFWGVSGLLMWWQLKATRWAGIGFVIVSAITATILMIGMHQEFINTPPRGEGGPGALGGPGGARPTGTGESMSPRGERGERGGRRDRGEGMGRGEDPSRGEGMGRGEHSHDDSAPNAESAPRGDRRERGPMSESADRSRGDRAAARENGDAPPAVVPANTETAPPSVTSAQP